MNLPQWVKSYLKAEDYDRVERAIREAERYTSGEIVPMIVERSSTVEHVPVLLANILLTLVLATDVVLLELSFVRTGHWLLGVGVVVVAALAFALARWRPVQRLLVSRADQIHQVHVRAKLEFYQAGLEKTRGATGVLLFVSLMEHRAVVLADKGIASKLPEDIWNEVVGLLIDGIKQGDMGQGFERAIQRCGEILREHFPIERDDKNELYDHLIIKN